jgi:hypothetical protein
MKLLILSLFFFSSFTYANIGDEILANYKSKLYRLPLVQQEHFSSRMYTITGNKHYLNPIVLYLFVLSAKFKSLVPNLNNELMIQDENKKLLFINDLDTEKKKIRIRKISLNFLVVIKKIYFYQLEKTALFPNIQNGKSYLQAHISDLEQFLLDKENIMIYGAQLINYVYYLYDLDIVDLRECFVDEFKKTFPNSEDSKLSTLDYTSKIYTMTHFIIAASNYYQQKPNEQSFNWIIDYFENNIDEIISRTENDIIVEVGVSFMLVNKENSPAVNKIKAYLSNAYSAKYKMLPSKDEAFKYDLVRGEHRNILAIMLFKWPKKLTPITSETLMDMLSRDFVLNDFNQEIHYKFNLI